jgi:SET domain
MPRGRRLLLTASGLLPLLPWWNAVNAENGASNDDGGTCGLYMAKSTIPDAGWGVFVGEDVQQGSHFDEDAAILVTDFVDPMPMPTLLPEYFWTSESTDSSWDASSVYSLLPGIGALANSHPTLLNNVINGGVAGRRRIGYGNASTGAFSHLVGHSFSATRDLTAGQELFANGFALGHEDLPEQSDYDEVDYDDAHKQSIDWLHQNGACLDRLKIEPSRTVPYQSGAFLKSNQRAFDQGQVIATLPMIALSREHMRLSNSSSYEQLMLNYCYGHPESSLLLFPYSPVVNFVNHATNGKANVGIRWSTMNNDTTQQLSVAQLLETTANAGGIVMELYAIQEVHPGEEILLDYGRQWETAWRKHDHEWRQQPRHHEPEPAVVADTEKNASGLREKPYQSPQLIRDAFRHEIHIPDDIFPIAWKNLAKPTCTLYMADSSVAGDSNRVSSVDNRLRNAATLTHLNSDSLRIYCYFTLVGGVHNEANKSRRRTGVA